MSGRPNILIIKTDQQRYDTLGCMKHPLVQTPHIDALAADAVLFDNAFCCSPLCVPSRTSFFSGQYPHRNGAVDNSMDSHLNPEQFSFIEPLQQSGYRIGLTGKNHCFTDAYLNRFFSYREEYGHWGKTHGTITDTDRAVIAYRHSEKRPGLPGAPLLEGLLDSPEPFAESQCPTARIAEDAISFLKMSKDQPFCLHLSFPDPHFPTTACEPFYSMYNPDEIELKGKDVDWKSKPFAHFVQSQANGFPELNEYEIKKLVAIYYGQITQIDRAIGRVLDKLKQMGRYDDTLIIFTSDHGDFGGQFGLLSKTKGFYEPLIRIPLILKLPGRQKGFRCAAQVSNIDVMSTVFEIIGLPVPEQVQGRSFSACLDNPEARHRKQILCEVGHPKPPPPPINYKDYAAYNELRTKQDGLFWFIEYTMHGHSAMIRKDGWKYCSYAGDSNELYNLSNDPLELTNLAHHPEHKATREKLEAELSALLSGDGKEIS